MKKSLFGAILILSLSHCSQSRRGNVEQNSEIWAAQEICSTDETGKGLRCMSIQPNITENYATVTITQLDFNPGVETYRLLAKTPTQVTWDLLADGLNIPVGGSFEIDPKNGTYIESYRDFVLEEATAPTSDGLNVAESVVGQGAPVIWGDVKYPELYMNAQ